MSRQTIDVSQLSGWSGLSEGTQAVTVKTIVNGVEDSASSNVVTVEKRLTKQTKEVSLLMVDGDQTILPDANMTMEKAIVKKPATLIPSNIRQGVSIGGVVGELTTAGKEEVSVTKDLNMASGNQVIVSDDNTKTLSQVTITKPDTFIAQNIKNGVNIGGIVGTYTPEIATQEKTITITKNGSFEVLPDANKVLSKVTGTVNVPSAKEEQEKSITITENKTVEITPDNGKTLSKVTAVVNVPTSGGGAGLNIEYGNTAPTDTSKLWIRSNTKLNTVIKKDINNQINDLSLNLKLDISTRGMGCAAVGSDIYLFGGEYVDNNTIYKTKSIYKYSVNANVISIYGTKLPQSASNIACAAVGTKIYLFGGELAAISFSNIIQVYDTQNSTLTTLSATLPTASANLSCAVFDKKIYLFGNMSSTIYVFDTTTNTINNFDVDLPFQSTMIGCAAVGTKIYLFSGFAKQNKNIVVLDIETKSVTTLNTEIEDNVFGIGCAAVGSNIYLFGGKSNNGNVATNSIQVFDSITNTIETLKVKLPNQIFGMACTTAEQKIYLFGGEYYENANENSSCLDTIFQFIPFFYLPKNEVFIQQDNSKNLFKLANAPTQVEIGIKNVYCGNENNISEFFDGYLSFDNELWKNINNDQIGVDVLSQPTISRVNDTTIQIDTVDDNADTIEVFADGVSIGEVII